MRLSALLCVASLGASRTLTSQSFHYLRSERSVAQKGYGTVISSKPGSGNTTTVDVDIPSLAVENSIPVQAKWPGGVYEFSDKATIAFVGRSVANRGYVGILKASGAGTAWALASSWTTPYPADFIGVAYSAATSRLYVWDATKKEVLWASYTVGNSPPTSWTTLVGAAQVPILGSADNGELGFEEDGPSPRLYVRAYPPDSVVSFEADRYEIVHNPSGPTVKLIQGELFRAAYLTDEFHGLPAGATAVAVTGPAGAHVDVVNLDTFANPIVIGSKVFGASGQESVSVSPLSFGSIYGVQSSLLTEITGPFASAVKKWGAADSLNASTKIEALPDLGMLAYLGHAEFRVPIMLTFDPKQATFPTNYAATLVVGYSTDPVVDIDPPNGRYVLLGTAGAFTTTASVFRPEYPGFGVVHLPIPNDPNLSGSELRFQWWVTLSLTDVRISDVQGVMIRGSQWVPPGAEAWFGAGLLAKSSGGGSNNKAAKKSWMPRVNKSLVSKLAIAHWLRSTKGHVPMIHWDEPLVRRRFFALLRRRK